VAALAAVQEHLFKSDLRPVCLWSGHYVGMLGFTEYVVGLEDDPGVAGVEDADRLHLRHRHLPPLAALDVGGRSIAVFGCGLDIIYPGENANLARRIVEQGALISEYPLGTRPRADRFPRRNRIMSGLSLGVLVVEAGKISGAMITAHLALEQNREVFAIPGSILSPASIGTNHLIQEGAKLVSSYTDILEELNLTEAAHQMEIKEAIPASETETLLLKQLGAEPVHIDEVCRNSGLPVAQVSSTLVMMELKGMVKQMGAMSFILAREARAEYRVRVD